MNNVLNNNIIIFYICQFCYKSKSQNVKKKFLKIIKIEDQKEIINVDNDGENFNQEINMQDDEYDDNIDLYEVDQER